MRTLLLVLRVLPGFVVHHVSVINGRGSGDGEGGDRDSWRRGGDRAGELVAGEGGGVSREARRGSARGSRDPVARRDEHGCGDGGGAGDGGFAAIQRRGRRGVHGGREA